jgi:hypothetical protein
MHQRALNRARINAVVPLFVPRRPSSHGRKARFVLLSRQAGVFVFNRMLGVYSSVPGPFRFTPDLPNNLQPHRLTIGLQPRSESVSQLGFNENIQFIFGHLKLLLRHLAASPPIIIVQRRLELRHSRASRTRSRKNKVNPDLTKLHIDSHNVGSNPVNRLDRRHVVAGMCSESVLQRLVLGGTPLSHELLTPFL